MKSIRLPARTLPAWAAVLLALPSTAAEPPAWPGRWLDWSNNHAVYPQGRADCDVGKSLATEWDANLRQLASAIARSGGALPEGLYGKAHGGVGNTLQDAQPCKGRPIMGFIDLGLWHEREVTSTPGERPQLKRGHGHYFPLVVRLNTFTGLGNDGMPDFLRGKGTWTGIGVLEQTASLKGFPVLGNSALVITPPGHAPAFVPLTLERALQLWLPAQAQALREQETVLLQYPAPQRDDFRRRVLEPMQALLARGRALQAQGGDALKKPAYLRVDMATAGHEIVAQPGPDTSALMAPNPAYFDPRLPRSALQLMVVEVGGLGLDQPARDGDRSHGSAVLMREFLEKVDWTSIAREALR